MLSRQLSEHAWYFSAREIAGGFEAVQVGRVNVSLAILVYSKATYYPKRWVIHSCH